MIFLFLKETDVEYEEKRANMSLTQAELDKENDYYCRQSSPLHEPDDGTFGDDIDDIVGMYINLFTKEIIILYCFCLIEF